MRNANVDDIWRAVGPLGFYQCKQVASYLLSLLSWSFQGLNIIFIGHRPNFSCRPLENDSLGNITTNVVREYRQCEIVSYENTTEGISVTRSSCENGWVYDAPVDQSFVSEWNFVCENEEYAELTQVLYLAGMMVGTFVFPTFSDRYGRKPVMVICHVALFGVSTGLAFSYSYTVFVILRLFSGFFQQGLLAGTTLSLESLPTEIRHYACVAALLSWTTFGCLISPIAYALNDFSWRYLQLTYALCSAWSLTQWWWTDESLRWVLANGQLKRAKQIVKNACKWSKKDYTAVMKQLGLDHADGSSRSQMVDYSQPKQSEAGEHEMSAMDPLVKENEARSNHGNDDLIGLSKHDLVIKHYNIFDIFKHRRILVVSMIMWYTWIVDSLVYNGLYMISSHLYGDRYINFFLSALVEYPASLFLYLCLSRIGRKWSIVIGHTVATVGLAVATALTYTAAGDSVMLATATAFTLIGKMGVTAAYSGNYLAAPELYPTNMRNIGLGVCSFMEKVGAMVAPFSRNVSSKIKWLPPCVFTIMCFFTVILFAFVPETNGVELPTTIEELKEWYRMNKFVLKFGRNTPTSEHRDDK